MTKNQKLVKKLWDQAPEWAKFLAVDKDGEVWAFEFYPHLTGARNWRSRTPDGKAKFLTQIIGTGYYGSSEQVVYKRGELNATTAKGESV